MTAYGSPAAAEPVGPPAPATTAPTAPTATTATTAPPAGPGVQPPFAAPPTDGDRTRVWVGLGVGAAALLLCCLGGIAGFGGLIYTGMRAVNEQARATVSGYLDAVKAENYTKAYGLLCEQAQKAESVQEFTDRVSDEPAVADYTLWDADVTDVVVLPADVRYEDGQQRTVRFTLVNGDTGELVICGVE